MTERGTPAERAELVRLVDKLGGASVGYELWDGDTLSLSELVREFVGEPKRCEAEGDDD